VSGVIVKPVGIELYPNLSNLTPPPQKKRKIKEDSGKGGEGE